MLVIVTWLDAKNFVRSSKPMDERNASAFIAKLQGKAKRTSETVAYRPWQWQGNGQQSTRN